MLILGYTVDGNEPVELSLDERRQGTYIIGTTGTGKSTLLKNIIYQDMLNDNEHGLCVLDPHGDLIDELLELVPKNRVKDVILFDPMDLERPFGLNLLECDRNNPHQVRWVISTIMGTLRRLYSYSWGPRLEHVLRNALLTAMLLPDSTFLELTLLLSNENYRKRIVEQVKDPIVREFWTSFPKSEREKYELITSTLNKISPFITDPSMRNIIGQPKSTVDLKKVMDEGKILFVNLSKGDLGEEASALLGSVIVNLVLISSLQRRPIPVNERRPFHLIVDEFQNMATESFAILQSEARKYAVDVVVAHQYRDQLLDDLSRGSTLNVGNMVILRTTGRDSYELASQFDNTPPPPEKVMEPVYKEYDKTDGNETLYIQPKSTTGVGNLYREIERMRRTYADMEGERANKLSISPNFEAWCRLINVPAKGRPRLIERHIVTENMTDGEGDPKIAKQIRENSRRLAKAKREVERDIARRSFGEIEEGVSFATVEKIR